MTLDNAERLRRGTAVLREDFGLDRVALRHSQEMAARGDIWHSSNETRTEPWIYYGENVGSGPDVDSVHRAFMRSAEHRLNILDPHYALVGAGVSYSKGIAYVTEVFLTRPRRPVRVRSKAPLGRVQPRKPPPRPRSTPSKPNPRDVPLAVAMLLRLAEWR